MAVPAYRAESPEWLTYAGELWLPWLRPVMLLVVAYIVQLLVREQIAARRKERERAAVEAARQAALDAARAESRAVLDEAVAAVEARRQRAPKVRQRPTRERKR